MTTITVYQFTKYDIANDENCHSCRWGTRKAIERIGGEVLENTATEVDPAVSGREIDGMTERNYSPHPRPQFQTQVRA
jgi:hypothetical protein